MDSKMIRQIRGVLFSATIAFMAPIAQATLILDFAVLNQVQTVGPSDVVTINVRLTDDAGSNENATLANIISAGFGNGSTTPAYAFLFGIGGDFYSQFAAMNVAPGQSFDFVFGQLTPDPGPVPSGAYVTGVMVMTIADGTGEQSFYFLDNVTVNVVGSAPEPATLALLGLGFAGLAATRRRKLN